ncbi:MULTISPECIES: IS481 family transposase [unclassified Mycobacterium]|uniref:IS481 family transposase n=1 Tax=unclassified Mycobacterium TaxID=2642494 RepID=UPI00080212C6|nr:MULTISPECIES: IS481 family transposase [unclassified Mycobacterium]OBH04414.1 transposase [Mycobacterium sp. E2699]OBI56260.1 transposase [Mycobacterium sp. E787]
MSKARLVVAAVQVEHRPISEVARDYRVARSWIYTLLARYRAEGEPGLEPRSRRPSSNPRQLPTTVEELIIKLRKQLGEQGYDAGPHTIAVHLRRQTGNTPAVSTIHKVLRRRGFITAQPHKRPRSSYLRFQADQPNECWQADITHWQLAGPDMTAATGAPIEILNILDDHSRKALTCTARPVFTALAVRDCFRDAYAAHGLPASVLTDNGMVFTARHATGPGGRTALQTELATLGVVFKNSRPYHPQTCGKVERFHQTLKKWLTRQPPAATLADLQAQLDTFTEYYNTVRPHRSCQRRTPQDTYRARPLAGPANTPPGIHWRVRTDRVDSYGKLTLRHAGRLHHIGIGHRWANTAVHMLIADLNIRIIATAHGQLIRELTLDTTRDYQPQKPKTPPANN